MTEGKERKDLLSSINQVTAGEIKDWRGEKKNSPSSSGKINWHKKMRMQSADFPSDSIMSKGPLDPGIVGSGTTRHHLPGDAAQIDSTEYVELLKFATNTWTFEAD